MPCAHSSGKQRVARSMPRSNRRLNMSMNIDDTKVQAEFKDGILNVRLPKSEQAKPKSVEVKIN